jgi:hypothetical protein
MPGEAVASGTNGRIALRPPCHLDEVGAGAEGPPSAREHHHCHRMIVGRRQQRLGRRVVERFVERVERLGAVEGQYADT